jgi:uncharacterized membrane protein
MKSRAAISGHPIHPMLVGVPIGLVVWTLIADIVYLATDRDLVWYDIAYWSGFAAWISALAAALPGFVDLLTVGIKSDARSIGLAHAGLNVTVVLLFLIATILMWDHKALTGDRSTLVIALHALATGFLGLSGWLGGEMVFRHHLAIVPDNHELEVAEYQRHAESTGRTGMGHVGR